MQFAYCSYSGSLFSHEITIMLCHYVIHPHLNIRHYVIHTTLLNVLVSFLLRKICLRMIELLGKMSVNNHLHIDTSVHLVK